MEIRILFQQHISIQNTWKKTSPTTPGVLDPIELLAYINLKYQALWDSILRFYSTNLDNYEDRPKMLQYFAQENVEKKTFKVNSQQ